MLHFNYVFFNYMEAGLWKKNYDGYYAICVRDLESLDGLRLVYHPLDRKPYLLRLLFAIHNSRKLSLHVNVPFKELWYPLYFKDDFKNDLPYCFIAQDYLPKGYIKYLKEMYPNCKIIKITRDLVRTQTRLFNSYYYDNTYDIWMSFDEKDSIEYNMVYFPEFESKIDVPVSENYPISDVFFAGRAKDRLPRLVQVYDKLSNAGISCFFYILGVPNEMQINRKGIVYSNKPLSYKQMLYYSVNSRCILEVNQLGAVGYTSRFLEAVMFNKYLITDNTSIVTNRFYNEKYMQVFDNVDSIDTSRIKSIENIDYQYAGEFSPIHLIQQIDDLLTQNGNN